VDDAGIRDRVRVEPLLRPLYVSARELLDDLFGG
jgi:hypothetical protein